MAQLKDESQGNVKLVEQAHLKEAKNEGNKVQSQLEIMDGATSFGSKRTHLDSSGGYL